MKIEFIVYLAISLLSAGLIVATIVALIHRRAVRLTTGRIETTLAQAMRDHQTVVEQLRNETNTRIVEMEQAINTIKVKFAAMNIEPASFKAPPQENSSSAVPKVTSSQEDTWTRDYSSADFSIVPTIGTNDDDTWDRDESADPIKQKDSATLRATAFSEGNLSTAARPGMAAQPRLKSVLSENKTQKRVGRAGVQSG